MSSRLLLTRVLMLFTAAAIASAQMTNCRTINSANAQSIASALGTDKLKGVALLALDSNTLLACSDDAGKAIVDQVVNALAGLKPATAPAPPPASTHSVRLFFNRRASDIAKALDKTAGFGVIAVGDDQIVFQTSTSADEPRIQELKRWIALLDIPLPEIVLNAWSLQVSASKKEIVEEESEMLRRVSVIFNERLQRALDSAWRCADAARMNFAEFADPLFAGYILARYGEGFAGPRSGAAVDSSRWCDQGAYCLGFIDAFPADRPMQPTLTNLLGVITAAKLSSTNAPALAKAIRRALEGGSCTPADLLVTTATKMPVAVAANSLEHCVEEDQQAGGDAGPRFACFQHQLEDSLSSRRLALLRAATANFFFHYKQSVQYPHDLSAYDFAASLQELDKHLDPLLVAFNRDVAVFLEAMQKRVAALIEADRHAGKKVSFQSSGIVTLRTISGTDSEVDVKSQNVFKETPPPLVQDFLKQLKDQNNAPTTVETENLATRGAMALNAFLSSGGAARVSIGREMDFTVTPRSLPGASAAELQIKMETKDNGNPQIIKAGDSSSSNFDDTSRVAGHMVQTNVRVDSLKLFEISSFTGSITRGRRPYPLLPPLVELPLIGSFVKYQPNPVTVYHRSFAVVSATIVPTASDMVNGLRFHLDLNKDGLRMPKPPKGAILFHQQMVNCIAKEAMAMGGPPPAGCTTLTRNETVE